MIATETNWWSRPLSPFASYVAVAALAVAVWGLIIVPMWRFCWSRASLASLRKIPTAVFESTRDALSRNKSLTRWLAGAVIVLLAFAVGLWIGWHKDAMSARLSRARQKSGPSSSSHSPAADLATYAMKLREGSLSKVRPQVLIPTSSRPAVQRYPWKMNIVTTVFWVGEKPEKPEAGKVSGEHESAWDANWTANYGGTDSPEPSSRRNYIPIAFVPRQNPFYCALPYNDVTRGQFKPEAPLVIPWFKQSYTGAGQSVCRNRWIAIRKGDRVCFAQWEDCGPFLTDDFQYVFGSKRPKFNAAHGAGLSVSPAGRDYLGLAPTDVTDWQFVEVRDVAPGPWRSYGDNNHFVLARRQSEQRVAVKGDSGAAESSTTPSATTSRTVSSTKSPEPQGR